MYFLSQNCFFFLKLTVLKLSKGILFIQWLKIDSSEITDAIHKL